MPNYAKFNYYNLLNLRPKSFLILLLVTIFIFTILFFIFNSNIYEIYYLDGTYKDNYITVYDNNNNSDTIINSSFIIINNKKYKYEIKNVEINNNTYVYKITLNKSFDSQDYNIAFYYPKLRIKEMLNNL
jgi:hypothetical protein